MWLARARDGLNALARRLLRQPGAAAARRRRRRRRRAGLERAGSPRTPQRRGSGARRSRPTLPRPDRCDGRRGLHHRHAGASPSTTRPPPASGVAAPRWATRGSAAPGSSTRRTARPAARGLPDGGRAAGGPAGRGRRSRRRTAGRHPRPLRRLPGAVARRHGRAGRRRQRADGHHATEVAGEPAHLGQRRTRPAVHDGLPHRVGEQAAVRPGAAKESAPGRARAAAAVPPSPRCRLLQGLQRRLRASGRRRGVEGDRRSHARQPVPPSTWPPVTAARSSP